MDNGFERYSCQITLPGFDESAQRKLQQAKVLVVGAGGLGCPASQYLAAAGIGTLGIADHDVVSASNLHRQILYTPADIGHKKVSIACQRLQQQNPGIKLVSHDARIISDNVLETIAGYDIIVDATDNFETRYLLNDACVITDKALVYGAIYQFEGQVAVWNVANDGTFSPNYRDLYPQVDVTQIPNCAIGGVIPTLAGIIGCIQANEVIKLITGTGEPLVGKLLVFDAASMQSRVIKLGDRTKTNITSITATREVPELSIDEVRQGLADDTLELVDIRTDQERDAIDIGGIHFEADEIDDHLDYLTNERVKVLYCSSGKRSAETVKAIKKLSPKAKVYSMAGGLQAWFNK